MKATGLKLLLLTLSLCFLFTGCFDGGDVHDVTPNIPSSPAPTQEQEQLPAWQKDVFEQITLFIQEGFRTYGIEGSYMAYFDEIEGTITEGACAILLIGDTTLWKEALSFSYDEQQDRYTFKGEWEPILTGYDNWQLKETDDFFVQIYENKNYAYKTMISTMKQFEIPTRYEAGNGPITYSTFLSVDHDNESGNNYYVHPMVYSYLDDRLEVYAAVEYPQIGCEDEKLEQTINNHIREAFLTDIGKEDMYTDIYGQYRIKRADDLYFSFSFYTYYNTQWGAHPSDGSTTLTINMQTGEVVTLEDFVGEDWTVETLLSNNAFVWNIPLSDERPEGWKEEVLRSSIDDECLADYNNKFYLTEDSLCILLHDYEDYFSIEAKLSDLGLE